MCWDMSPEIGKLVTDKCKLVARCQVKSNLTSYHVPGTGGGVSPGVIFFSSTCWLLLTYQTSPRCCDMPSSVTGIVEMLLNVGFFISFFFLAITHRLLTGPWWESQAFPVSRPQGSVSSLCGGGGGERSAGRGHFKWHWWTTRLSWLGNKSREASSRVRLYRLCRKMQMWSTRSKGSHLPAFFLLSQNLPVK